MTGARALASFTLRGLLGRRRTLLLLLLASLPVLIALLLRLLGGDRDLAPILDTLVVRTVLPLVALVIGTAAIGSEIEDGTLVYLLVKPIPRPATAAVKVAVAAGVTAALVVPPMLVTGVLVGGFGTASLTTSLGFALAAIVGGAAYAAAFTALGIVTSRALIVGLAYVLLWEGVLAGLLEGTRYLSVRQATLGLATAITSEDTGEAALDLGASIVVLGVAIAAGYAVAAIALSRFQIRSAD